MTPDELRRMDNDLCIIFEKGLKPIKTRKYYYFEKPKVIKDLQSYKLDHNEFQGIERGEWRKYNPYNPYVPENENTKLEDKLKIDSLDDLFETDDELPKEENKIKEPIKARKYYYFEKPRVIKDLQRFTLNHNEFQGIERGEWRKYNPYNPYVPESDKQKQEDKLKIDSLDDLFEDDAPKKETVKVGADIKEDAPVLPQDNLEELTPKQQSAQSQEEIDLQKELEAKFDELFGPIDDE